PVTRRNNLTVCLFAQNLYISPAVIPGQKYLSLHSRGHDDGRVCPKAIGFCERSCYDRTKIGTIQAPIVFEAVDPNQGLRWKFVHVLLREKDRNGVVLTRWRIKVCKAHRALGSRERLERSPNLLCHRGQGAKRLI